MPFAARTASSTMVVAISGLGFSKRFPEATVLPPLVWFVATVAVAGGPLETVACCLRPRTGAVNGPAAARDVT